MKTGRKAMIDNIFKFFDLQTINKIEKLSNQFKTCVNVKVKNF